MSGFRQSLLALGRQPLPPVVTHGRFKYELRETYKHDFFAATAMYADGADRVLIKFGRRASFLGVPMAWSGRLLTNREAEALRRLQDVQGIPRLIGTIDSIILIREYVEGHALSRGEQVPDGFHDALAEIIGEIHARGMAYVDLEKCENVLVKTDGTPCLFDFQIAWMWKRGWGGSLWPVRVLRDRLQAADRYHLVKLRRRTRPDQLSPEQLAASYAKPWYIGIWTLITRPFTLGRRSILNRLGFEKRGGERGRFAKDKPSGVT